MRLTEAERKKAAKLASMIGLSPHEWPKEQHEIQLLCHGYLDGLADNHNLRTRIAELEAERDAAKAGAERLKAELAAEENNCPYPDFSCGTFAAERGIELRPAGGPTYTTTSDHWQGILRDLDAARAGEARAVEGARNARAWEARTARLYKRAIKALRYMQQYQTEKGTGTALSILVAMEDIDDVLNLAKKEIGRHVDESLAWLAQREREAAAEALLGLKDSIRGGTYRPHVAWRCISTRAAALRAGKGEQQCVTA